MSDASELTLAIRSIERSEDRSTSGAQLLVAALEALGVEVVFGLPGAHNLAVWAALARSGVRLVGVRHEQTAVYAADGYARCTGRLGVAITTTGPGAANALAATGEAWASGSPVLVIATDIATSLRREGVYRGALHETRDQAAMFAPVVKEAVCVPAAETIAPMLRAAASCALRAPSRPVYLQIPTDLLGARQRTARADPPAEAVDAGRPQPDAHALRRAAALLSDARKPLIWVGGGAVKAGAGAALAALARQIAAPVLETYMARGVLPSSHPGWVGLPPHVPEVGALWDHADAVLAVGSDFDGMMTQNWRMPAPQRLIAVNVDAADAAKNYRPEVLLLGDARDALTALAAEIGDHRPAASEGRALAGALAQLREAVWSRLRHEEPDATQLLDTLGSVLDEDTVVFADMCIPGYWIAGFQRFERPRRLAYPVGWGTLGFALPASIGGGLAGFEKVLCVCGDGGFLFAAGELATLAQERIALTVLLFDDHGYGMLRYDQRAMGGEPFGLELETPDWCGLAASFGIAAEEVDELGAPLARAIEDHLARAETSMIVVRRGMRPPPNTSPRWYRAALVERGG